MPNKTSFILLADTQAKFNNGDGPSVNAFYRFATSWLTILFTVIFANTGDQSLDENPEQSTPCDDEEYQRRSDECRRRIPDEDRHVVVACRSFLDRLKVAQQIDGHGDE